MHRLFIVLFYLQITKLGRSVIVIRYRFRLGPNE